MHKLDILDDHKLLLKIQQDDVTAFTTFYERHWEGLYNEAFKRLQQEPASQDLVQDIFTDIWIRRNSLNIENVPAYLHTAVRFQVFKFYAKNKLSRHFLEPFENITEASLRADCNIHEKELNTMVNAWMKTLPRKRQHIYRMHVNENLSTKEIASRLSISQKTVQNQLGNSMQSLRSRLANFFSLIW